MSSCLSRGTGRAYGFDLENIVKSSSATSMRTSHSSSPSSNLSESSNSPMAVCTRKPRTQRKRPNQTYNEAAALLSTACPTIFSINKNNNNQSTLPNQRSYFFNEPPQLILPFPVTERPIKMKPSSSIELKDRSPIDSNSNSMEPSEGYQENFDTDSMLDEEIEAGIDSIMGKSNSIVGGDEISNAKSCFSFNFDFNYNTCYGYPMGLGFGGNLEFNFGLGLRNGVRALRNVDERNWWSFPAVNVMCISPPDSVKLKKAPTEKKKKVEESMKMELELGNPIPGERNLSLENWPRLLLKLNYEKVLNAWSDKGSPLPEEMSGSESPGSDIHARLAQLSWQLPTTPFNPLSLSIKPYKYIPSVSSTFCCLSNGGEKVNSTKNGYGGGGVHVPRQKYIAISKSELLDAIVTMFDSRKEKDEFLLMSSCLDSILHAEHKSILEEMRTDYDLTHSANHKLTNREDATSEGKDLAIDLSNILGYSTKNIETSQDISRVPVDTRFQRAFIQLLYNAEFEELSAADLMLTSALNTDYLLTLPVYVDWKKASESKAIIFRRGYATERQNGLLIGEKLDYLQSKLLQALFFGISKPLGKIGIWFAQAFEDSIKGQDLEVWIKRVKVWLKEVSVFRKSYIFDEQMDDDDVIKAQGVEEMSDKELPIWIAAQRAVARYEGILSSSGPRGRLLRKLLMWTGLIPSMPEKIFNLESDITSSESYLRPIFLSRISLSDIWEPASRKFCENNPWKMLKTAFSIFLSRTVLQEPAFQELILLYTKETEEKESINQTPVLQLKIYEKIPIPDLPVIFPHKKLSFRILDTVRLDAASILGLLAYFINYKFEDIKSSPSAILLDVIAASALVIYLSRIILGYKQTWDRYQLLVNRTLYEKTLASGFGSVHFLLDASEQQQYKEAILAYAILLKSGSTQATFADSARDQCERFMYDVFRKKVEMPIDKAVNTLMRLDLLIEKEVGGRVGLLPIPCSKAYTILKQRWNSFVS